MKKSPIRGLMLAFAVAGIAACGRSDNAYIVTAEAGEALLTQCLTTVSGVSSFWTPVQTDVAWPEDALAELDVVANPDDYIRQYFGVEINNTQLLFLHAVHPDAAGDNNADFTAPVFVCEGGTAAWGALYDFTRGEFTELSYD